MRLRCLLLCLLITSFGNSFAQDQCLGLLYGIQYQDSVSVFSQKAFVRKSPSPSAVVLDSLPCGTWIKVLPSKSDELKLVKVSGYHSYWLPISYKINNETRKGFVWSGALAISDKKYQDKRWMLGMGYVSENSEKSTIIVVKCRFLDSDNKELWSKDVEIGNESASIEGKIWDGMGLSNVQNVLRIMSSGEACGIPTDYKYFAWKGDSMVALPSRYCVGDAGVYYYDEAFVFPSEKGGKPNTIIKKIESEEYDENDKPTKKMSKKVFFAWDGRRMALLSN